MKAGESTNDKPQKLVRMIKAIPFLSIPSHQKPIEI